MRLLKSVCRVLDEIGADHALIGASALAMYGVARSTVDVDLLVLASATLNEHVWAPLRAKGAKVDLRIGDADDPLRAVIRIERAEDSPVDVIVGKHAWQEGVLARARTYAFAGVDIRAPEAADLILLKLFAGGPGDRWDILRVIAAAENREQLYTDVESRLVDLDKAASHLWLRMREEADELTGAGGGGTLKG